MLTKSKVLQSIKEMSEKFSIEEMIDQLVLLQKIEVGMSHSETGKTFTTVEAKSKLKKWLK
jgi:predicted transcriptional regulator